MKSMTLEHAVHFTPATVTFCEARLHGWIAEPANTWSSLGYIVIGIWLFVRRGAGVRLPLGTVALAEIGIGIGSLALHGTGTFVGEVLDLAGMFMLSACIFGLSVGRLLRLGERGMVTLWACALIVPFGILWLVHGSGIVSFATILVTGFVAEIALYRRDHTPGFQRFLQMLALLIGAFVVWTLDVTHVVCDPDNHVLGGHAIWHLMCAWSIERLYTFYQESLR